MNNKIVVAIIVGALIISGTYYFTNQPSSDSPKPEDPKTLIQSNGGSGPVADCDNPQIKGNINSSGEKIYHVPGGQYYGVTKIDKLKGEEWFCTEAEAISAGWRKSLR